MDMSRLASLKNRTSQRKLYTELSKMEQAHKTEMRILQNKKKKFRDKYLRLEQPPLMRGKEGWNIRMYETHNPGFCYHRTGKRKTSDMDPKTTSSETHQALRELMLTNGEVDIEKLLCLHLLAAHSIFHTSPPPSRRTGRRSGSVMRTFGPYASQPEQYSYLSTEDFYRSGAVSVRKRKGQDGQPSLRKKCTRWKGVTKRLPTYVLDLKDTDDEEDENEEVEIQTTELDSLSIKPPLALRPPLKHARPEGVFMNIPVFVNTEIESIIDTVIEVLLEVNPKKVRDLTALSRSPSALRKMMSKPEVHNFIDSLYGKPFICSSDSFQINAAHIFPTLRKNLSNKFESEEIPPIATQHDAADELLIVRLEMKDTSFTSSLERVVEEIRKNVLNYDTPVKKVHSLARIPTPVTQGQISGKYTNVRDSSARSERKHDFSPVVSEAAEVFNREISRKTLDTMSKILNRNLLGKNKLRMKAMKDEKPPSTKTENIDSKSTRKFSVRKLTCPACIERLKFPETIPKRQRIKSSSLRLPPPPPDLLTMNPSPVKLMTSKFMEDIMNVVSRYGSAEVTEGISPKESYGFFAGRKPSMDGTANENDSPVNDVLRKLSNAQRIQIARKAASIKNRQINIEGSEGKIRTPLTYLFDSVLSKGSILELSEVLKRQESQIASTVGTSYAGTSELEPDMSMSENKYLSRSLIDYQQELELRLDEAQYSSGVGKKDILSDKNAKVNLAKMKYEIAEREIARKLSDFLNSPNPDALLTHFASETEQGHLQLISQLDTVYTETPAQIY